MKRLLSVSLLLTSFSCSAYNLSDYYSDQESEQLSKTSQSESEAFYREVNAYRIDDTKKIENKEPFNILVAYPGNERSDYWRNSNIVYKRMCESYKTGCNIEFYKIDISKPTQEVNHILNAAYSGVDYLIYHVDLPHQSSLVERILSETDTQVLLNNTTLLRRNWKERKPLILSGFDHYRGSSQLATYYNVTMPDDDIRYIGVFREDGLVNESRWNGFKDNLYTNFSLKEIIYKDIELPTNVEYLRNTILENNISIIFSTSTDITLEIVEALSDLEKKVYINGWGCTDIEIEMLKKKKISNCIFRYRDDVPISIMKAIEWSEKGKPTPLIYRGRITIMGSDDLLHDYILRDATRVSSHAE